MKSDRTRIGMFDSGIGGLSVLHQALKSLPEPEYLYYADTDHVPYGTRTVEEIREFTDEIIRFLTEEGAQAVIIACNTATSAAVSLMREKYSIPIIGMEPAVKPALLLTNNHQGTDDAMRTEPEKRVLVMATPLTLRESKLEALIAKYDAHHLVDRLPAEELVRFAERDDFDEGKIIAYLKEILAPFHLDAYGAVVLGCTHFNYFLPQLHQVFPAGTHFIDGVMGTIRRTADLMGLALQEQDNGLQPNISSAMRVEIHVNMSRRRESGAGCVRYFFSGREIEDAETLDRIRRLHERLEFG